MQPVARQTSRPTASTTTFLRAGLVFLLMLSVCVRSTSATGYSYPFGYFNISTERAEVGFIQILVCSAENVTNLHLSLTDEKRDQYDVVGPNGFVNVTISYKDITVTEASAVGQVELPYGFVVTAESNIHVSAIKADEGTTDGYYVLPLTNYSKEFFVAGARSVDLIDVPVFSGILMASAFNATCIEVYRITNGNKYRREQSIYLPTANMIAQLLVNTTEDPTGLYVNSSKPISVLSGVSCGQVPVATPYCDHMAEQLPPVGELGMTHVVPPIDGRAWEAGYIVRVVGTEEGTVVDWKPTTGLVRSPTTRPLTITRGEGTADIDVSNASKPLYLTCSKPCVVMQYNKGKLAYRQDRILTDPFMMLTTSVEHFASSACFQTAQQALPDEGRTEFQNYVAIVTLTSNITEIRLDNQPIAEWQETTESYSVATQRVTPGAHSVTVTAGSTAKFGAWVYGHSTLRDRTAYGMAATYEMFGTPIGGWIPQPNDTTTAEPTTMSSGVTSGPDAKCDQTSVTTGSSVVNSPGAVQYSIRLIGSLKEATSMFADCRQQYIDRLKTLLNNVMQAINARICNREMCPYLSPGGVIIPPGAALDANTSNSDVTLQMEHGNEKVTGVSIRVPYYSIETTTVEAFAQCRKELNSTLTPFANWLLLGNSLSPLTTSQPTLITNKQLVEPPTGCPPMTFDEASFTEAERKCTMLEFGNYV